MGYSTYTNENCILHTTSLFFLPEAIDQLFADEDSNNDGYLQYGEYIKARRNVDGKRGFWDCQLNVRYHKCEIVILLLFCSFFVSKEKKIKH